MRQDIYNRIMRVKADEPNPTPAPESAPTPTTTPAPEATPAPDTPPAPQPTPNFALMQNPEVVALVERGRTEERTKLHAEIEAARNQAKASDETKQALALQIGGLTSDLNAAKAEILRLEALANSTADERVTTLNMEIVKLNGELASLQANYTRLELETFKQQQIQNAGGALIVEMVGGNTMEEIQASVVRAKETYAKYNATPNPDPNQQPTQTQTPTPAPTQPHSTPQPASGQKPAVDLTNLNPMKGKAHRQQYAAVRPTLNMGR